jgi:hypothetical protein
MRYAIEQVEDDPEFWHVIDTLNHEDIIEICVGSREAQAIADSLNRRDAAEENSQ